MFEKSIFEELKNGAKFLFDRGFLQISQGSISAKIDKNQFIINNKNSILSDLKDENFQILGQKKDFRWDDANFDCFIHQNIYKNIPMANFFCIATPKSTISYSLNHNILSPKDFYSGFESLKIYDPKNFVNWNERAFNEILNFLQTNKTNVVIVKGIGIFIYEKTLSNLLGLICNIEHSVKILHIYETNKNFHI